MTNVPWWIAEWAAMIAVTMLCLTSCFIMGVIIKDWLND